MGLMISGSVGQGGVNRSADVAAVQGLLNRTARAKLELDGKCGPMTIAAIKVFQAGFLRSPDGRVDVGGTTWRKLHDGGKPVGPPAPPMQAPKRNELIIRAVDDDPQLNGAGIVLIDPSGRQTEIRGGPRRQWVYISAVPLSVAVAPPSEKQLPTFWDQWGNTVLNCGSATATGVVIYLSGGTATLVVGAFAVNSAALCGMSLGKAIEYDAWQEFEQDGGGAYKAWLTLETAMALADLFNGVKGAMGFLKSWNQAGKLAKLQKAVAGRKLSRKQLLKLIKEIDPEFQADLAAKGKGYYSKAKLVLGGQQVLIANNFKSLANQQARVLVDAVGNALTLAGTPDTWTGSKKTYEVWVVQYNDKPEQE